MKKILSVLTVGITLVFSPFIQAVSPLNWTLNASIQHSLKVAPEMNSANAEVGKQQGKLQQAEAWPNPSISIQVDDALGREDASGGYDITQISISQPLAFSRLEYRRRQAEAQVFSAQAQRRHQQLALEYKVAQRFHLLQLTQARLNLAEKRLQQAIRYQGSTGKRQSADLLIRYLTPLEFMRLDIVLQVAQQIMEVAEGEHNEATASFKALLNMPVEQLLSLDPLTPVPTPEAFETLLNSLQHHPMLEVDKQLIASSRAGVDVAKSERLADPTLTLFSSEEFLGNRRQNSSGVMLNIQVPLWNQNSGTVTQARYTVRQARAVLDLNQRELRTNLHKSYLHLGHLIKQAEHYRSQLLSPSKKMFKLTRKGFEAGELNVLTLIDANNIYFDAQERYLELLQEGWQELAEVRKSAGLFVAENTPMTHFGEVK